MATEAEIQQMKDDILDLQSWKNSIESKKRTVVQFLETSSPDHIVVSEGGVLKKVPGTPILLEKVGTTYLLKDLNGVTILEIEEPI